MTGVEKYAEAVLHSETFRNAPSSRRLLKFFADRLISGDTDPVKEYTIGVEAFSKPTHYDPRLDSTVRIQIGRLRQKLAEYYAGEGKDDALVLDLPKGRLALVCQERNAATPPPTEPAQIRPWRITAALAITAIALITWALWPKPTSPWGTDLDDFWRPFTTPGKPVLITYGDPLFLQYDNKLLVRDPAIERPEDIKNSDRLATFHPGTGTGDAHPVRYYAAIADVNAAFLLGQRLGRIQPAMSLVRSSQLLWQQMADANVLFLGPPRFLADRLQNLPLQLAIDETPEGFRVRQPSPGEPAIYRYRDPVAYFSEDGEAHVLVTRTAGPDGRTDLLLFASNSTYGRLGAVDALTSPAFGRTLAAKMTPWPRYFQILLRVKYKAGVPTETTYLLHRPLERKP